MYGIAKIADYGHGTTVWWHDGSVTETTRQPVTYIPKPENPSKLIRHCWNGKEWVPTAAVKFVGPI